jgi:hypothetical protein
VTESVVAAVSNEERVARVGSKTLRRVGWRNGSCCFAVARQTGATVSPEGFLFEKALHPSQRRRIRAPRFDSQYVDPRY